MTRVFRGRVVTQLAVIAGAVLLLAPDLWASGAEQGAEHGAADKPALLDWDLGSAFWSIIVFVVLLTVLRFAAWKPILEALQKREAFIRDSLEAAKRDRDESERILKEYSSKIEMAREEATAIVDEGRRDGEEVRKRIHAQAKSEADAMVERAKNEIGLARDAAVKELYDRTVVLATSVAGKIVRKELTPADHRSLVEESLAEMERMKG